MNKHELKSLLENIYSALTEEAAAPKLETEQAAPQPEYLYLQLMKGANPIRIPNPAYVKPLPNPPIIPEVEQRFRWEQMQRDLNKPETGPVG
jgi:hypothetical protein